MHGNLPNSADRNPQSNNNHNSNHNTLSRRLILDKPAIKKPRRSTMSTTIPNSPPAPAPSTPHEFVFQHLSTSHEQRLTAPWRAGKTPFIDFYYILSLPPRVGGEIVRSYANILGEIKYTRLLYHFIRTLLHVLPSSETLSPLFEPSTKPIPPKGQKPPQADFSQNLISEWLNVLMFGAEFEAVITRLIEHGKGGSGLCGAQLTPGEPAYFCGTCSNDDPSCVICRLCFKNSDHEGHDVRMSESGGGICDCGNLSAWALDGCCHAHRGPSTALPPQDVMANVLSNQEMDFFVWPTLSILINALATAFSQESTPTASTFDRKTKTRNITQHGTEEYGYNADYDRDYDFSSDEDAENMNDSIEAESGKNMDDQPRPQEMNQIKNPLAPYNVAKRHHFEGKDAIFKRNIYPAPQHFISLNLHSFLTGILPDIFSPTDDKSGVKALQHDCNTTLYPQITPLLDQQSLLQQCTNLLSFDFEKNEKIIEQLNNIDIMRVEKNKPITGLFMCGQDTHILCFEDICNRQEIDNNDCNDLAHAIPTVLPGCLQSEKSKAMWIMPKSDESETKAENLPTATNTTMSETKTSFLFSKTTPNDSLYHLYIHFPLKTTRPLAIDHLSPTPASPPVIQPSVYEKDLDITVREHAQLLQRVITQMKDFTKTLESPFGLENNEKNLSFPIINEYALRKMAKVGCGSVFCSSSLELVLFAWISGTALGMNCSIYRHGALLAQYAAENAKFMTKSIKKSKIYPHTAGMIIPIKFLNRSATSLIMAQTPTWDLYTSHPLVRLLILRALIFSNYNENNLFLWMGFMSEVQSRVSESKADQNLPKTSKRGNKDTDLLLSDISPFLREVGLPEILLVQEKDEKVGEIEGDSPKFTLPQSSFEMTPSTTPQFVLAPGTAIVLTDIRINGLLKWCYQFSSQSHCFTQLLSTVLSLPIRRVLDPTALSFEEDLPRMIAHYGVRDETMWDVNDTYTFSALAPYFVLPGEDYALYDVFGITQFLHSQQKAAKFGGNIENEPLLMNMNDKTSFIDILSATGSFLTEYIDITDPWHRESLNNTVLLSSFHRISTSPDSISTVYDLPNPFTGRSREDMLKNHADSIPDVANSPLGSLLLQPRLTPSFQRPLPLRSWQRYASTLTEKNMQKIPQNNPHFNRHIASTNLQYIQYFPLRQNCSILDSFVLSSHPELYKEYPYKPHLQCTVTKKIISPGQPPQVRVVTADYMSFHSTDSAPVGSELNDTLYSLFFREDDAMGSISRNILSTLTVHLFTDLFFKRIYLDSMCRYQDHLMFSIISGKVDPSASILASDIQVLSDITGIWLSHLQQTFTQTHLASLIHYFSVEQYGLRTYNTSLNEKQTMRQMLFHTLNTYSHVLKSPVVTLSIITRPETFIPLLQVIALLERYNTTQREYTATSVLESPVWQQSLDFLTSSAITFRMLSDAIGQIWTDREVLQLMLKLDNTIGYDDIFDEYTLNEVVLMKKRQNKADNDFHERESCHCQCPTCAEHCPLLPQSDVKPTITSTQRSVHMKNLCHCAYLNRFNTLLASPIVLQFIFTQLQSSHYLSLFENPNTTTPTTPSTISLSRNSPANYSSKGQKVQEQVKLSRSYQLSDFPLSIDLSRDIVTIPTTIIQSALVQYPLHLIRSVLLLYLRQMTLKSQIVTTLYQAFQFELNAYDTRRTQPKEQSRLPTFRGVFPAKIYPAPMKSELQLIAAFGLFSTAKVSPMVKLNDIRALFNSNTAIGGASVYPSDQLSRSDDPLSDIANPLAISPKLTYVARNRQDPGDAHTALRSGLAVLTMLVSGIAPDVSLGHLHLAAILDKSSLSTEMYTLSDVQSTFILSTEPQLNIFVSKKAQNSPLIVRPTHTADAQSTTFVVQPSSYFTHSVVPFLVQYGQAIDVLVYLRAARAELYARSGIWVVNEAYNIISRRTWFYHLVQPLYHSMQLFLLHSSSDAFVASLIAKIGLKCYFALFAGVSMYTPFFPREITFRELPHNIFVLKSTEKLKLPTNTILSPMLTHDTMNDDSESLQQSNQVSSNKLITEEVSSRDSSLDHLPYYHYTLPYDAVSQCEKAFTTTPIDKIARNVQSLVALLVQTVKFRRESNLKHHSVVQYARLDMINELAANPAPFVKFSDAYRWSEIIPQRQFRALLQEIGLTTTTKTTPVRAGGTVQRGSAPAVSAPTYQLRSSIWGLVDPYWPTVAAHSDQGALLIKYTDASSEIHTKRANNENIKQLLNNSTNSALSPAQKAFLLDIITQPMPIPLGHTYAPQSSLYPIYQMLYSDLYWRVVWFTLLDVLSPATIIYGGLPETSSSGPASITTPPTIPSQQLINMNISPSPVASTWNYISTAQSVKQKSRSKQKDVTAHIPAQTEHHFLLNTDGTLETAVTDISSAEILNSLTAMKKKEEIGVLSLYVPSHTTAIPFNYNEKDKTFTHNAAYLDVYGDRAVTVLTDMLYMIYQSTGTLLNIVDLIDTTHPTLMQHVTTNTTYLKQQMKFRKTAVNIAASAVKPEDVLAIPLSFLHLAHNVKTLSTSVFLPSYDLTAYNTFDLIENDIKSIILTEFSLKSPSSKFDHNISIYDAFSDQSESPNTVIYYHSLKHLITRGYIDMFTHMDITNFPTSEPTPHIHPSLSVLALARQLWLLFKPLDQTCGPEYFSTSFTQTNTNPVTKPSVFDVICYLASNNNVIFAKTRPLARFILCIILINTRRLLVQRYLLALQNNENIDYITTSLGSGRSLEELTKLLSPTTTDIASLNDGDITATTTINTSLVSALCCLKQTCTCNDPLCGLQYNILSRILPNLQYDLELCYLGGIKPALFQPKVGTSDTSPLNDKSVPINDAKVKALARQKAIVAKMQQKQKTFTATTVPAGVSGINGTENILTTTILEPSDPHLSILKKHQDARELSGCVSPQCVICSNTAAPLEGTYEKAQGVMQKIVEHIADRFNIVVYLSVCLQLITLMGEKQLPSFSPQKEPNNEVDPINDENVDKDTFPLFQVFFDQTTQKTLEQLRNTQEHLDYNTLDVHPQFHLIPLIKHFNKIPSTHRLSSRRHTVLNCFKEILTFFKSPKTYKKSSSQTCDISVFITTFKMFFTRKVIIAALLSFLDTDYTSTYLPSYQKELKISTNPITLYSKTLLEECQSLETIDEVKSSLDLYQPAVGSILHRLHSFAFGESRHFPHFSSDPVFNTLRVKLAESNDNISLIRKELLESVVTTTQRKEIGILSYIGSTNVSRAVADEESRCDILSQYPGVHTMSHIDEIKDAADISYKTNKSNFNMKFKQTWFSELLKEYKLQRKNAKYDDIHHIDPKIHLYNNEVQPEAYTHANIAHPSYFNPDASGSEGHTLDQLQQRLAQIDTQVARLQRVLIFFRQQGNGEFQAQSEEFEMTLRLLRSQHAQISHRIARMSAQALQNELEDIQRRETERHHHVSGENNESNNAPIAPKVKKQIISTELLNNITKQPLTSIDKVDYQTALDFGANIMTQQRYLSQRYFDSASIRNIKLNFKYLDDDSDVLIPHAVVSNLSTTSTDSPPVTTTPTSDMSLSTSTTLQPSQNVMSPSSTIYPDQLEMTEGEIEQVQEAHEEELAENDLDLLRHSRIEFIIDGEGELSDEFFHVLAFEGEEGEFVEFEGDDIESIPIDDNSHADEDHESNHEPMSDQETDSENDFDLFENIGGLFNDDEEAVFDLDADEGMGYGSDSDDMDGEDTHGDRLALRQSVNFNDLHPFDSTYAQNLKQLDHNNNTPDIIVTYAVDCLMIEKTPMTLPTDKILDIERPIITPYYYRSLCKQYGISHARGNNLLTFFTWMLSFFRAPISLPRNNARTTLLPSSTTVESALSSPQFTAVMAATPSQSILTDIRRNHNESPLSFFVWLDALVGDNITTARKRLILSRLLQSSGQYLTLSTKNRTHTQPQVHITTESTFNAANDSHGPVSSRIDTIIKPFIFSPTTLSRIQAMMAVSDKLFDPYHAHAIPLSEGLVTYQKCLEKSFDKMTNHENNENIENSLLSAEKVSFYSPIVHTPSLTLELPITSILHTPLSTHHVSQEALHNIACIEYTGTISSTLDTAPLMSSCGHAVHVKCFKPSSHSNFFENGKVERLMPGAVEILRSCFEELCDHIWYLVNTQIDSLFNHVGTALIEQCIELFELSLVENDTCSSLLHSQFKWPTLYCNTTVKGADLDLTSQNTEIIQQKFISNINPDHFFTLYYPYYSYNHNIILDQPGECPLCRRYTNAFIPLTYLSHIQDFSEVTLIEHKTPTDLARNAAILKLSRLGLTDDDIKREIAQSVLMCPVMLPKISPNVQQIFKIPESVFLRTLCSIAQYQSEHFSAYASPIAKSLTNAIATATQYCTNPYKQFIYHTLQHANLTNFAPRDCGKNALIPATIPSTLIIASALLARQIAVIQPTPFEGVGVEAHIHIPSYEFQSTLPRDINTNNRQLLVEGINNLETIENQYFLAHVSPFFTNTIADTFSLITLIAGSILHMEHCTRDFPTPPPPSNLSKTMSLSTTALTTPSLSIHQSTKTTAALTCLCSDRENGVVLKQFQLQTPNAQLPTQAHVLDALPQRVLETVATLFSAVQAHLHVNAITPVDNHTYTVLTKSWAMSWGRIAASVGNNKIITNNDCNDPIAPLPFSTNLLHTATLALASHIAPFTVKDNNTNNNGNIPQEQLLLTDTPQSFTLKHATATTCPNTHNATPYIEEARFILSSIFDMHNIQVLSQLLYTPSRSPLVRDLILKIDNEQLMIVESVVCDSDLEQSCAVCGYALWDVLPEQNTAKCMVCAQFESQLNNLILVLSQHAPFIGKKCLLSSFISPPPYKAHYPTYSTPQSFLQFDPDILTEEPTPWLYNRAYLNTKSTSPKTTTTTPTVDDHTPTLTPAQCIYITYIYTVLPLLRQLSILFAVSYNSMYSCIYDGRQLIPYALPTPTEGLVNKKFNPWYLHSDLPRKFSTLVTPLPSITLSETRGWSEKLLEYRILIQLIGSYDALIPVSIAQNQTKLVYTASQWLTSIDSYLSTSHRIRLQNTPQQFHSLLHTHYNLDQIMSYGNTLYSTTSLTPLTLVQYTAQQLTSKSAVLFRTPTFYPTFRAPTLIALPRSYADLSISLNTRILASCPACHREINTHIYLCLCCGEVIYVHGNKLSPCCALHLKTFGKLHIDAYRRKKNLELKQYSNHLCNPTMLSTDLSQIKNVNNSNNVNTLRQIYNALPIHGNSTTAMATPLYFTNDTKEAKLDANNKKINNIPPTTPSDYPITWYSDLSLTQRHQHSINQLTQHSVVCHNGALRPFGIFMKVHSAEVVMVHRNLLKKLPSPYLDSYGEAHIAGIARSVSTMLYLDLDRYRSLTNTYYDLHSSFSGMFVTGQE